MRADKRSGILAVMKLTVIACALAALILVAGCSDSPSPDPSTNADAGIEQSQRDLLRECVADPQACKSASIKTRRDALRACVESSEEPFCEGFGDEARVLTPNQIESCAKRTGGIVIEGFPQKVRQQNIAEADVLELLRLCQRAQA